MDKKVYKRYSEAFKREVVREYESGASAISLREKYGIGGYSTVTQWVRKYGREGSRYELMVIQKPEERARVKALEERIADLEKALAQVTLDKLMLESTVEVLEEELGKEVKKNTESRSSTGHTRNKRPQG